MPEEKKQKEPKFMILINPTSWNRFKANETHWGYRWKFFPQKASPSDQSNLGNRKVYLPLEIKQRFFLYKKKRKEKKIEGHPIGV